MSCPLGPAPDREFVLTLSRPDRAGLVRAVSGFLVDHSGNIRESRQFDDRPHGRFCMRVRFGASGPEASRKAPRADFAPPAEAFRITWRLMGRPCPPAP
jgi:formyltetrahydrofolate deformylase